MALNLHSLAKSIAALGTSVEVCDKNWGSVDEDMQDTLHAGHALSGDFKKVVDSGYEKIDL